MRVRDLGALTVVVDTHEQPVVGAKAAAMLALLTINANERVSVDALMHAAWGERITAGAASTLTSHIWRLRQVLEPARNRGQPPSVLVNDSDGYRLICGPGTVDSLLFAEAVNEVRELLATGRADSALRRADSAAGLWRGTPYGVFAETEWAHAAVARLSELRSQLQERRIEALLASGAPEAALSDLLPLVAAMPLRQSLRALQMHALCQVGRVDQALQIYQDARMLLIDEVGIEPGHELQQLHQRILRDEPPLTGPAPTSLQPSRRRVDVQLPVALTPLVGRADDLESLTELVRMQRLVTVIGAAGCGKTRLAVEVARTVASAFPDGVWFVDLTAVSDPDLVPEATVSTIGFAGTAGAAPLQDLRRYLPARKMLLVLDNCEHVLTGADQVVRAALGDPDVPAECCLLLTSREPVGIQGETIWSLKPLGLPGERRTEDAPHAPAVELFLQRLAAAAPTLSVDQHVLACAAEISIAVDGLPLPLELAAARALSHSLDDIAAQVRADPGRLSRAGSAPRDHRGTVHSAIEWSHQLLSPEEQRAHRRLAVLPGAFTTTAAAAVVAPDDDLGDIDDLLSRLVGRSMLNTESPSAPLRSSAFRQLATVRSHARRALDAAGETADSLERRDRWTSELLAARPPLGTAAEVDWYRRIDEDYPTVRATLSRRLVDEPSPEGARQAHRLACYWYYRERLVEAVRWMSLGRDVLGDETTSELLLAEIWLATGLIVQRRLDLARPHLVRLEQRVDDTPPDRLVEVGEALVALTMSAYQHEEPALMNQLHAVLARAQQRAGDANLAILTDAVGCCALLVSGRVAPAVALARSVQVRAEQADNLMAGWISTAPLIVSALFAERPLDGLPWIDRCLAINLRLGTGSVGTFVETRANFVAQLGDYVLAARTYSASHTATRRAGLAWPNREWTPALLDRTRSQLSHADYERAWQEGAHLDVADLIEAGQG